MRMLSDAKNYKIRWYINFGKYFNGVGAIVKTPIQDKLTFEGESNNGLKN